MLTQDTISCEGIVTEKDTTEIFSILSLLLPGSSYTRPKPFFVADEQVGPTSRAFYKDLFSQTRCREIPIHLFAFLDAIVVGQGTVIVDGKHLLLDSAIEYINHGVAPDGMVKDGATLNFVHSDEIRCVPGTSVLVKRPWYRNFGHWLVDLMPILPLVHGAPVAIDRIIFGAVPEGPLKKIMEQTALTYYPAAEILFMDDQEPLRFQRLLYVRPVHVPPLFKHPVAVQTTVDAAKKMFSSPSRDRARRIYISRQKLAARTVTNNDELMDVLDRHGFETFYPEDHSFGEQIAQFEAAEIVVGAKGAGLTNAMFCHAGAHVLALSPPDFVDTFFWDLLAPRGIHYSEIFCKAVGEPKHASHVDFEVDIGTVKSFLGLCG